MSTEFITLQPPPGSQISNYIHNKYHSDQPSNIPSTFLDAMAVREEVFVDEQKCSLEEELDADDHRCYHWVTYASVNKSSWSSSNHFDSSGNRHKRDSTGARLAVGTIRLVPPPHPPHPEPAPGHETAKKSEKAATQPHNMPHGEPYIKLGRLATLSQYRKLGLGRMLVDAALGWAARHPDDCARGIKLSATGKEHARIEGATEAEASEEWKGLVLVHAQTYLQKFYASFGFMLDESMGEWVEEGIWHVGMWMRLQVERDQKHHTLHTTVS